MWIMVRGHPFITFTKLSGFWTPAYVLRGRECQRNDSSDWMHEKHTMYKRGSKIPKIVCITGSHLTLGNRFGSPILQSSVGQVGLSGYLAFV